MPENNSGKGARKAPDQATGKAEARRQRLATQLRENLKKRKELSRAQARATRTGESPEGITANETDT